MYCTLPSIQIFFMYNVRCTLCAIHICYVYPPPREETKHFYSMRRKRVRKKGMTWTYFGRALIWFCLLLIIPPIDHDLAREDLVIIAALLIDWLFCSSSNQNNNWSTSFHSRSHRFSSSSIFTLFKRKDAVCTVWILVGRLHPIQPAIAIRC